MRSQLELSTQEKTQFINITPQVQEFVTRSRIPEGACTIYIPHTTAAVLIQENADPNVLTDLANTLDRLVPKDLPYLHQTVNKNAPSHIKASLIGASQTVLFSDRKLILGRYQFIYVCEFDGPRTRNIWLRVAAD
jgi:secondary thiamine-phosphate synthase enzyme